MSSMCVYAELPEKFHKFFPKQRGGDDRSPPHVTVLYVGDIDEEQLPKVVDIVNKVASKMNPITCNFGKQKSFPEGEYGVPHYIEIDAGPGLKKLHKDIWKRLEKNGLKVEHSHDFNPHATLKYLPEGKEFRGDVPKGEFVIDSIQSSIWHKND